MISELLYKNSTLELVAAWKTFITELRLGIERSDPKALEAVAEAGWTEADLEHLAELETLFAAAAKGFEQDPDGVFITSDENLSVVQTIMEYGFKAAGMVDKPNAQALAAQTPAVTNLTLKPEAMNGVGKRLFGSRFDEPGLSYVTEGIRAIIYRQKHGKHDFSTTPPKPFPLAERARFVILGDWGTGIPRADHIGRLAKKALAEAGDRQRHAVHLGDIYFCGWPNEVQERFLDLWPTQPGDGTYSWSLNGNHDMYSGGTGYFDVLLGDERFAVQGGCSYFLLENDAWQIMGLDSAYEEWSFSHGQILWAEEQRARAPHKQNLLFSHHQPFSAYEHSSGMANIADDAKSLLKDKRLAGWIWGHEHRCAAYGDQRVDFTDGSSAVLPFGCCLGNSGVPTKCTREQKPGLLYAMTDSVRLGLEKFGVFCFGVLDVDGPSAKLEIWDEFGKEPRWTHQITGV